ncbi:MAG: peptidylprolyl isomerase [Bacteroidetes bacterium]|nr:peptidylprolyl isomerase [Bacteroidota bacterium]
MKTFLYLSLSTLILFSCSGTSDDELLRVGDYPIKKTRYQLAVKQALERIGNYSSEDSVRLTDMLLEEMINNARLTLAAREAGFEYDTAFVNRQSQMIKASVQSDSVFEQKLRESGITEEDWMNDLRDASRVNAFLKATITDSITVASSAIMDSLKQSDVFPEIKVSQIMVKVPVSAPKEQVESAYRRLDQVRKQAEGSGTAGFSKLARLYSEDGSARFGGDLGYIRRGTLISHIEEVAFSMEKNKVSDIFRSPGGFHILMVTDKREVRPEEADLSAKAIALTRQAAYEKLKTSLKDKYPVVRNDD